MEGAQADILALQAAATLLRAGFPPTNLKALGDGIMTACLELQWLRSLAPDRRGLSAADVLFPGLDG